MGSKPRVRIRVSKKTKAKLVKLLREGETFDDLLQAAARYYRSCSKALREDPYLALRLRGGKHGP